MLCLDRRALCVVEGLDVTPRSPWRWRGGWSGHGWPGFSPGRRGCPSRCRGWTRGSRGEGARTAAAWSRRARSAAPCSSGSSPRWKRWAPRRQGTAATREDDGERTPGLFHSYASENKHVDDLSIVGGSPWRACTGRRRSPWWCSWSRWSHSVSEGPLVGRIWLQRGAAGRTEEPQQNEEQSSGWISGAVMLVSLSGETLLPPWLRCCVCAECRCLRSTDTAWPAGTHSRGQTAL